MWCSFDKESSRPETAEKTTQTTITRLEQPQQKQYNNKH